MKIMRKGQTMVEYIIIVCLIAVSLIAVFTYLSRAIGRKAAGAAEALSEQEGSSAKGAVENISEDTIKQIGEDGWCSPARSLRAGWRPRSLARRPVEFRSAGMAGAGACIPAPEAGRRCWRRFSPSSS